MRGALGAAGSAARIQAVELRAKNRAQADAFVPRSETLLRKFISDADTAEIAHAAQLLFLARKQLQFLQSPGNLNPEAISRLKI